MQLPKQINLDILIMTEAVSPQNIFEPIPFGVNRCTRKYKQFWCNILETVVVVVNYCIFVLKLIFNLKQEKFRYLKEGS